MENSKKTTDAWLVYYSENEWYPSCLLYEPRNPEDFFRIDKVKIIFNNEGKDNE